MSRDSERVGRPASHADVPAVAACLASAFFDDPLWGHWTFPDERVRARDMLPFMTLWAQLGLGELWTDMTAGGEAIAVWTPPGKHYGTPEVDELLGPRAEALHELFAQFDDHLPDGRYYHLEWWATHGDHRGHGLGSALLRENLRAVDADHAPVYLESTNPANLERYRALGFSALDQFKPPDGPLVTTMWREAR